MKELEERMTAVQGTLATKKQFYSQLKSNGDKILSERTSLEQERQEYDRKIGQKEYEIKNMKKESHNSLSVFGAWVPRVTSRIEQALKEGLFEKKPRGPLGAYVKLKDASWAPAIENFLSSTLFTYCVHSGNDSRALTKIFNEVLDKNERAPSIITLNDVSRNRVQSNEFSSVLDMLIISDTVVCNTLIDNREIETILLIPTSSQACATLSDKRNVPLNCKRAITKKGDQFYPDPNYRTYAARGNLQAKFLQVSMKDAIRVAEEELKRMIMNKKHTESQLSEVMKRMKENRSELAGVEKLMDDLRNKCLRIKSRINELKNSEEPEPTSISTLTTELNEVMEKRQVLTENISKLQTELGHLKCEVVQSESKLKEARNASRSILEEEHPLSNQVQNIQSKRNEIISRKHYRQAKYTEMCKRVSQIESEYSKQQLVVDKRTSDALQVCQRIETNKSPQEVKKELSDCQNYMAGVEQHSGSIEDIGNALFEKKTKYTEIMSGLKYLDSSLKKLHVMYEDRQKKINSICKLTGLRIQHMFKFVLHQRNYTGNLHIDYNANTLDVEVCPNTRNKTISDTKNLSGGERSYATVAFVMALWDAVDPPFYFLDEFDVFMVS
ncbi:hypothetical protein C0J52_23172 [Blattella germanica]|nr:hypothetical protein C0J52_23172 [Blattella germanica]